EGVRIADETAQKLLEHSRVQPCDDGLFPGCAQSWRLRKLAHLDAVTMTLGSHQTSVGKTQVHITPHWIIEALGPFDLDPAAADPRPWACAAVNYMERDDGLRQPWFGRVWLNPAFDRYVVPFWIRKLARHGCGTALLHARTET